jgi:hypothetical protein
MRYEAKVSNFGGLMKALGISEMEVNISMALSSSLWWVYKSISMI